MERPPHVRLKEVKEPGASPRINAKEVPLSPARWRRARKPARATSVTAAAWRPRARGPPSPRPPRDAPAPAFAASDAPVAGPGPGTGPRTGRRRAGPGRSEPVRRGLVPSSAAHSPRRRRRSQRESPRPSALSLWEGGAGGRGKRVGGGAGAGGGSRGERAERDRPGARDYHHRRRRRRRRRGGPPSPDRRGDGDGGGGVVCGREPRGRALRRGAGPTPVQGALTPDPHARPPTVGVPQTVATLRGVPEKRRRAPQTWGVGSRSCGWRAGGPPLRLGTHTHSHPCSHPHPRTSGPWTTGGGGRRRGVGWGRADVVTLPRRRVSKQESERRWDRDCLSVEGGGIALGLLFFI